jgi:hypothetical protein
MNPISLVRESSTLPPKITSTASPTQSAEAYLETLIKDTLGTKNPVDVKEFKNFLEVIGKWVCISDNYSLSQKKEILGETGDKLSSTIAKYNPAFAVQLEDQAYTLQINKHIQGLSSTLNQLSMQHRNINDISVTDKVIQSGLTEDGSKLLSESLAKTIESVKFSDESPYSEAEQKAILFTALENATKIAFKEINAMKISPAETNAAEIEKNTQKIVTALSNSLNESLAEHAFKLDKSFIIGASQEIANNASLIGSINNSLASSKLINFVTGDADPLSIEERCINLSKTWSATLKDQNISSDDIKSIQKETDKFIANLGESINSGDYDINTKEGRKEVAALINTFKSRNLAPENASPEEINKAKLLNAATSNYFDLVMHKAAEANNIHKDSSNIFNSIFGSGILGDNKLGDLFGKGVGAMALFAVLNTVIGGSGLAKKALGLVFVATVMNNTGLLTGAENDNEKPKTLQETAADNIPKSSKKPAPAHLKV